MASFDASLVVPGQPITAETGYLRGHGCFIEDSSVDADGPQLVSCVAGQIERVNKLITVRPLKSRYIGEVGDLIVGRVTAVESKRWKADIGAQKDATLQLSSVNLPGGVQRMRTHEDQLQVNRCRRLLPLATADGRAIDVLPPCLSDAVAFHGT
jgi:exosome complex component RRP4